MTGHTEGGGRNGKSTYKHAGTGRYHLFLNFFCDRHLRLFKPIFLDGHYGLLL